MNVTAVRLKLASEILRRFPPETPGKTRLARKLLGSSILAKDVKIRSRRGIEFVTPSIQEPVGFYLLINGVYEADALEFILGSLEPGGTFIDVGANIGSFTLPVARHLGAGGRVIAIESSPKVFPYLRRNVALNALTNISLIQGAAADTDRLEAPFYEAPLDNFGMGSLGAQFHDSPISVTTRTLDSILEEQQIERVNLIKVDVEGFEVAVFRGAEKLLTGDNPPTILFEFCDWAEERVPRGQIGDAQRLLWKWGYSIWRIGDKMTGKPPLTQPLTTGYEILVASKSY
jgi:FkbM family methyltransferase